MASVSASGGGIGIAAEPEAAPEFAGRARVPTPSVIVFRNLRRPFPFLPFVVFFGIVVSPPLWESIIPAPGACCKASCKAPPGSVRFGVPLAGGLLDCRRFFVCYNGRQFIV